MYYSGLKLNKKRHTCDQMILSPIVNGILQLDAKHSYTSFHPYYAFQLILSLVLKVWLLHDHASPMLGLHLPD